MRKNLFLIPLIAGGMFAATAAYAECSGGNGRGWASGKGKGQFEMTAGDTSCLVSFPSFIDDTNKTKTPATEVKLTRAPKAGKITLSQQGIIYTPTAGFKGSDSFCISNTAPGMKGKLSGCVSIAVK